MLPSPVLLALSSASVAAIIALETFEATSKLYVNPSWANPVTVVPSTLRSLKYALFDLAFAKLIV